MDDVGMVPGSGEGDDPLGGLPDRDLAFQVWVLKADRSHAKTERIVLRDYGRVIPQGTISSWAGRHAWHDKAGDLIRESAPRYIERAAATMASTAPEAMQYLQAVVSGRAPTNEKGEVDKGRVAAAFGVLDRVGFLPVSRSDAQRLGTPATRALSGGPSGDAITSLSDDDLEREIRARFGTSLDVGG